MNALLRKEARLLSDVVFGSCVLLAASFPLAFAGVAMQGVRPFPWISALAGGCILNQYTMVLTGALLGAAAFAREREEGNVHFLAMLPLTHARHYASKAMVALSLWFVLWVINALALIAITLAASQGPGLLAPFLIRMFSVVILSFAALGFASLAGSRIDSVTGAAFASGAGVLAVAVLRSLWTTTTGAPFFSLSFLVGLGLLGAAGIAGAAYGFNRTEAARRYTRSGSARVGLICGRRSARGPASALLWKDARLMRLSTGMGLLVFILPLAAAGGNALIAGNAAPGFRTASLLSIALGWIILPLWSAGALASEWASSSHQFLAYLPVSARRIVLAKLAVAIAPALLVLWTGAAVFFIAQSNIIGEPAIRWAMSWDEFNTSHFLGGAIAYTGALPVTFAVAWYFAARLRRKIVAIVLGVVSGPLAMAAWAVTSAPEGFVVENLLPLQAAVIHGIALAGFSGLLVVLGARHVVREGM